MSWTQAKQIVGERGQLTNAEMRKFKSDPKSFTFYNDFCLIQDRIGRWHCIGIFFRGDEAGLFHSIGERIDRPYRSVEPIWKSTPRPDGIHNMFAPGAIWKDSCTALMLYAHTIVDKGAILESSIRVWESTDPQLDRWSPKINPLTTKPYAFSHEMFCRDPEVLWDEERRLYFMYYVVGDGWITKEEANTLRVRTSSDLLSWSEPRIVMAPPPGYKAAESIFVLKKDHLYYLWVCGFDYGRMSLYISEDPMDFGDPAENRIMEQSGHAPQIVYTNGEYWMACAATASQFGNPPAVHDLPGVYIQRVKWIEADGNAREKIKRV